VHRSLGQQRQDSGADIAAAAASALSTTSSTARARAEAEAARSETPTEAGTETRTERPVMAGVLTADVVAELATGLPALFVQCTPCMGVKAEALCSGAPGEPPLYMGEWVVHMSSVSGKVAPDALPIQLRYIENYRDATLGI
jgi:hypothetical protein